MNDPALAAAFTLKEALGTAYETNAKLAAEQANLRATDEGLARADAGWRPNLSGNGYYGTADTDKASGAVSSHPTDGQITLSQPIFRGGKTYAEFQRAKSLDLAEQAQLSQTEQSVLLAAVTAYMDVVRDTGRLNSARDNVATLQTLRNSVNQQLAAGEVTRTDLQQAEARLAQGRSGIYAAEAQLAASRANFEHVIGRPVETLEDSPPLPSLPPSLESLISVAQARHPTILVARQQERAAGYNVDDAVGDLLPQVSVVGQYQYTHNYQTPNTFQLQAPQNQLSVLAEVTVPIYQGGGEYALVRQAKQLRAKAQLNTTDIGQQVVEDARSAWAAHQAAGQTVISASAVMQSDQLAVAGETREQQAGERSVIDVLNAQQEYQAAQINYLNAVHDSVVTAYRVLAAQGGLTAKEMGLDVKTYDPAAYYNANAGRWIGLGD
ncbi:MAG TPA: TolC family outer membrane protein [Bryobacteraceae bacterium]|nr:TolC family outer membrane protein [Bryobacteraceae bacterium]